jgi:DNA-directed RNA polymerase specialized sigma24 family protein
MHRSHQTESPSDDLREDFTSAWDEASSRLSLFFRRSGIAPDRIDDLLQSTAMRAWKQCVKLESIPDKFSLYSRSVASNVLRDSGRMESLKRADSQPPKFFEELRHPFADLWGRRVPSGDIRLAEDYSIAPLDWPAIADWLESIAGEDSSTLFLLGIGVSIREIGVITGRTPRSIKNRLNLLKEGFHNAFEGQTGIPYWETISQFPTPLPPPYSRWWTYEWKSTLSAMRLLPEFVPEWIAWLHRLLEYTATAGEPVTLGVIRRLAMTHWTLHEEQGRRFIIAASKPDTNLLSQKFILLEPNGEARHLSFSDVYRALRGDPSQAIVGTYACSEDWMDQVVTFWEPTMRWGELQGWWTKQ